MSTVNLSPDADAAAANANYDKNKGGMNKEQNAPGRSGDRTTNDPNKSKSLDSDTDRKTSGAGNSGWSTDKSGKPQQ